MDLLVLGGTRFVGRHLVELARIKGHHVTMFNRGQTGPALFPDLEQIHGDRDGGLGVLAGRSWDAVIDTCGYVPRLVADSARALRGLARHYTFVSSVSAYAEPLLEGLDEAHPLAGLADPTTEIVTGESYGGLKAACERAACEQFGGAVLIVRPGLIVGPYDSTDRFPYWPRRIARGGEVLAPGDPDLPVQVIDARDLAAWMLVAIERELTGPYNAVGPHEPLSMRECLEGIAAALGVSPRWTWVDEAFLLAHGVEPWTQIPLWVTASDRLHGTISGAHARDAGLWLRPLAETARDTLAWDAARDPAARAGSPALTETRERELLAAWSARGRA